MALGMVNGRFQFQRATKKDWEDSEIVLLDGEIAIESDTTKMKAGDGKTIYKDLPYISIGDFSFADLTEEEKAKVKGKKGDPFTYDDFTQKQLDELKGEKGEPFRYEDFTKEQLASLKGEKGDAFTYKDFTKDQLEALKGEPGKDGVVTFEALTDEQRASLKGEPGKPGEDGNPGKDGDSISIKSQALNINGDRVIVFSDGTSVTVPKGKDGEPGKPGQPGKPGDKGDPGKGIVDSRTGVEIKIWSGTQTQYNSISSKNSNTLYLIKE